MYAIKFTIEAEETFDVIVNQLKERFSERIVIQLETELEKTLNNIAVSPLIFPIIDERTEVRRCVLHKHCSMFYRVVENNVVIICFWDNRQSPIW